MPPLRDPAEAVAVRGPKLGQPAGQAALRQHAVLGTIVAIDVAQGSREVAWRRFRASRRRGRIVLSPGTGWIFDLASLGRLQQGEAKFSVNYVGLLSLRRQRRNPAIGRINDARRARAGASRKRPARCRAPHACPCRPAPPALHPIRIAVPR